MTKTSIVVPVYNTAEYLRDCFNSIYNQTQKEIEVIALNDGSTDDSLYILKEIKREHPELIIFSQENKGLGAARNKGMELATGEFIFFMDSDDCIVETALDTCYRYAKTHQLDIVMFDAVEFGDMKYKVGTYDRSDLIKEHEIVLSGEEFAYKYWLKAYRPSAWLIYADLKFLKRNKLKFLPEIYYEDNEFHCKAIPSASRVMYIPQALYRRRWRKASITTSAYDMRHARDYLFMIQAVDKQKCNERLKTVMHELKKSFLRGLYQNSVKNNLMQESQFAGDFLETALHVCGGAIENINDYSDIEILYLISEAIPADFPFGEMRKKIRNRKKEILNAIFAQIPFQSEGKRIGIYGTGEHTDKFLKEYQECVGEIRAEIIPIESHIITGEKKYRNKDIINVADIASMKLECIVVASSKFEQEICDTIKLKYGNQYRIIRLFSDLHF